MPPEFALVIAPNQQDRGNRRNGRAQEWTPMDFQTHAAKENDIGDAHQKRRDGDQKICSTHLTIRSRDVGRGGFVGFPNGNALDSRGMGHLANLF